MLLPASVLAYGILKGNVINIERKAGRELGPSTQRAIEPREAADVQALRRAQQ